MPPLVDRKDDIILHPSIHVYSFQRVHFMCVCLKCFYVTDAYKKFLEWIRALKVGIVNPILMVTAAEVASTMVNF